MECEEEEIVFISPPPTPPPPQLIDIPKPSQSELDTSSEDKSKDEIEIIDDESDKSNIINNQKILESDSLTNSSNKIITKNLTKKSITEINKEDFVDLKSIKKKQIATKTPTKPGQSLKNEATIEESTIEFVEEKVENLVKVKPAPIVPQSSGYSAILAKFYSRKHGLILPSVVELDADANKKFKSQLPADLRIGNYPAKVLKHF